MKRERPGAELDAAAAGLEQSEPAGPGRGLPMVADGRQPDGQRLPRKVTGGDRYQGLERTYSRAAVDPRRVRTLNVPRRDDLGLTRQSRCTDGSLAGRFLKHVAAARCGSICCTLASGERPTARPRTAP